MVWCRECQPKPPFSDVLRLDVEHHHLQIREVPVSERIERTEQFLRHFEYEHLLPGGSPQSNTGRQDH